ncbi:MAG: hypothetical protein RRY38_01620, partial [Oscillospiraceae bacterium]
MLTLVYGRAGSGKSRYCVERALELARQGERSTIVVPEQSSFSCERALVSRGADAPLQFVQTRSFRKLCEDIFSERGGGAQVRVGEAQKCALVRRALESLGDDVKFYRRCRKDSAFFALVAQAADELKNAAVTPEDLAQAAQQAESAHSRDKLIELSLICERYGTLLLQTGCDAASELQSAAEMCRSALQFRDTTIFFDGYSGFTEPEFSLLFSLLARSSELVCTLCCDDPESTSDDALAGVRATGRRLLSEATSRGIPSRELSLGASHRFQAEGLRAAEGFFACGDKLISRDGVYLLKARDRYDEAERVAAEISMLVRERGFCYSEIAVITRDIELYRAPLERTFNRFGIPFFTDAEDNLLHAPTTAFLLCALSLARSLTTEKLLALLKTSLCGISAEQVAALENYAFVWSVEGAAWFSPFEKNPDGFGPLVTESQRTALANVEALRARVAIWLSPYLDSAKLSRGKALVSLIYELMENCGALETLAHEDSRAVRVACAGISLLEQLYDIACDDELTASELGDLARTLASSTPLSDIPPALEQVVIGGADRTRVDEPRALFALGLNDGVFPRTEFDAPLLTQRERELLGECGIRLGRDIERCEKMEELYLYR